MKSQRAFADIHSRPCPTGSSQISSQLPASAPHNDITPAEIGSSRHDDIRKLQNYKHRRLFSEEKIKKKDPPPAYCVSNKNNADNSRSSRHAPPKKVTCFSQISWTPDQFKPFQYDLWTRLAFPIILIPNTPTFCSLIWYIPGGQSRLVQICALTSLVFPRFLSHIFFWSKNTENSSSERIFLGWFLPISRVEDLGNVLRRRMFSRVTILTITIARLQRITEKKCTSPSIWRARPAVSMHLCICLCWRSPIVHLFCLYFVMKSFSHKIPRTH